MTNRKVRAGALPGQKIGIFRVVVRLTDLDDYGNRKVLFACAACKGTHVLTVPQAKLLRYCPKQRRAGTKYNLQPGQMFGLIRVLSPPVLNRENHSYEVDSLCTGCGTRAVRRVSNLVHARNRACHTCAVSSYVPKSLYFRYIRGDNRNT